MAKAVGFSRTIKMPWIEKTIELINEGLPEDEIKAELDNYLSFEIKDPTNLGKARNILMNVWVRDNDYSSVVHKEALGIINKYPNQALAAHWCLMMMAYPVFKDLCKLIGKMSEFQDAFTLKQMKKKLYDEWGETTTLMYSIDKLVATLKNIGALKWVKAGTYTIEKICIDNEEILGLIAYTIVAVSDAGYHTVESLNESTLMFPFNYKIDRGLIVNDSNLSMNNFGGELTISIN